MDEGQYLREYEKIRKEHGPSLYEWSTWSLGEDQNWIVYLIIQILIIMLNVFFDFMGLSETMVASTIFWILFYDWEVYSSYKREKIRQELKKLPRPRYWSDDD